MKKSLLAVSVAIASLLAANAFAQADKPGESKAAPSAPATAAEKAEAKQARKAEGKTVAKSTKTNADASPESMGTRKSHTKPQHKAARAHRKAEGTKATKEPKDQSGPAS